MSRTAPEASTPLSAQSWNETQALMRERLHQHDHADKPLPGSALAPSAELTLETVTVQDVVIAGESTAKLMETRLPSSGGAAASLRVSGDLRVLGGATVEGKALPAPPKVTCKRYDSRRHGAISQYALPLNSSGGSYAGTVMKAPAFLGWAPIPNLSQSLSLSEARVFLCSADFWVLSQSYTGKDAFGEGQRYPIFVQPFVTFADAPAQHFPADSLGRNSDPQRRSAWTADLASPWPEAGLLLYGASAKDMSHRPYHSSLLLALPLPPGDCTVSIRYTGAGFNLRAATLTLTPLPR